MNKATDLTRFQLNQTELLELLSVAVLAQMHTELLAQIKPAKPAQQSKISMTLSILEKAINLKKAQITLIGNS